MKILFAIQGTGNGHLSRAMTLLPELKKYGEIDLLISGTKANLAVDEVVSYHYKGLSFSYGKYGGIDFKKTFSEAKITRLIKEYETLPVEKYDLVINDFEPLTAWACKIKQVPCIGLSHQSALFEPGVPLPQESDYIGSFVLKHYAPVSDAISFHFQSYSSSIFTPVIREDLRNCERSDRGHITVYLPAYDDDFLSKIFTDLQGARIELFSKSGSSYTLNSKIKLLPIEKESFASSIASAHAVICGAGFETPSEALFLGKKLMVIPMKNQYEQQCNAAALADAGITVLQSIQQESVTKIQHWLDYSPVIQYDYPNQNELIFKELFKKYEAQQAGQQQKKERLKPQPLFQKFF
jgi:uncharacterized protein (TIGR00661 family)